MNRTLIALILILWCIAGSIQATASTKKTIIQLPEVVKPISLLSDDTQFYVVEQVAVNIYKWDGFRFQKKIGSRGEGPQEYNICRICNIHLTVHLDKIIVYTSTKCLEYQLNGSYIREYRLRRDKIGYNGGFYKLGNYYIYDDLAPGDKLFKFTSYYLADSKLNKIRELSRFRLSPDVFGKKLYIFDPYLLPVFYKEMAFLTVGDNLEIIGINSSGKTFLNLKYHYDKVKVTEEHIAAYHQYYKTEDPDHALYERRKLWFRFPEYFPAIKNFKVDKDLIYVQTWKQNELKESEFLIFNLKGKYVRTIYLPVEPDNIETDYPYLIHNGQFAQLIENLDEEAWELHIMPIPN